MNPSTAAAVDSPWLHLPLNGVHLIEASAGTGKTFTLATLFARLVIERKLKVSQIVTVTFTNAAVQELRKRIRERLLLAARLANGALPPDASHEQLLTQAMLHRHLLRGDESAQALARRLQTAAGEMDLAAISTIHGFCMRVLSEHALDSDHGFVDAELLPNLHRLETDVANDLWRQYSNTSATLEPLLALWNSPKKLAQSMTQLTGPLPLLPPRANVRDSSDPTAPLVASAQALATGVRQYGDDYAQQILAAIDAEVLKKNSHRKDAITAVLIRLQDWAKNPQSGFTTLAIDGLEKLTLDGLTKATKTAHTGKTPTSPLQPVIADYLDHYANWQHRQQRCAIDLLHELRESAYERMAEFKRQHRVYTNDDLIEHVASALHGEHAAALAGALRKQYAVALVDEFQDTDARQWSIFQRVFANDEHPALFLIGDPKQAIYGFRGGDVQTYLRAKQSAAPAPALDHNFRSRPALLRALETLYCHAGATAFVDANIQFIPVAAGGVCKDSDYLLHGHNAPGITLRVIQSGADKALKADASRAAATRACVAEIASVLSAARTGQALIHDTPVAPGDMAVLVRNHKEAARMQRALALAGIPATAAGKMSLFATHEAREIHTILSAMLHASDPRLLRAALASLLLGLDAQAIAALDADALNHWHLRLFDWRERCQRGGVFSLINQLCADNAQRLLHLADGERRLTNYLQLGEHLQTASAAMPGWHGLIDWLEQRIASADPDDETQLLRLESDARRVQIVTLHKSKGLEYPLVYLPFAAIGGKGVNDSNWRIVHAHAQRELHWKIDADSADWKHADARATLDRKSEDARLLYVGLTRAVHALWIAAGDLYNSKNTALAPMLDGQFDALHIHPEIAVVYASADPVPAPLPAEMMLPPAPRIVRRHLVADWWMYSFTQLVRAEAGRSSASMDEENAASDEPAATAALPEIHPSDLRFSGSRFGNVLHAALETTDFAAWAHWQPDAPAPQGQATALSKALREHGYHGMDAADGLALLTQLVGNTLTVNLPEGGALHALPKAHRRAELEFHFHLPSTSVSRLVALLHDYGVMHERSGFGNRQQLHGLMTGKIDLTYVRAGRWYVLDYKSNRLPQYDPPALAHAMRHSEYDLQALIYTLALHRWLRFRLGDGYAYPRDFGGIRYLFCRGLDTRADGGQDGIYAQRFAPNLVAALDALFAGEKENA